MIRSTLFATDLNQSPPKLSTTSWTLLILFLPLAVKISWEVDFMTVGIIGLGLIGGSMAKTIKRYDKYKVLGFDKNYEVTHKALDQGTIDDELSDDNLNNCDIVLIALYPQATVEYIKRNCGCFKENALVMDLCGVKQSIVSPVENLALEHGFAFIGAHPMAGMENSGYDFSSPCLFDKAPVILTPYEWTNANDIKKAHEFYKSIGFGQINVSTAKEHDRIIAFTSQLAHVVSNAYVKSPAAGSHHGFSAGSYNDLTRVAKLNEDMWTQLFLNNASALSDEIDALCVRLQEYSFAIKDNDDVKLKQLLKEGREIKEQADNV
ncbi:MAG: prephenate dehydrogenase/arogenate dehydrogenase family protein [Oscillospiraceae bacterium]|jgi:prephenate dehydrogenase|nr:prephenate dehydrogenase/arogenate dehydrogenase family protein [Oscillospiraceae bacterium]